MLYFLIGSIGLNIILGLVALHFACESRFWKGEAKRWELGAKRVVNSSKENMHLLLKWAKSDVKDLL